jgi:putative PIN family toxin of toxin-antitoxin system
MIVVLDSNIWITLAIGGQLKFIESLCKDGLITIAACEDLTNELITVLLRPKFRKYFPETYLEQFLLFYHLNTKDFEVSDIVPVVADKKDDYLFALCKTCDADYFITGDKLLLEVGRYYKTSVNTFTELKKISELS